jgi:nitroreductase
VSGVARLVANSLANESATQPHDPPHGSWPIWQRVPTDDLTAPAIYAPPGQATDASHGASVRAMETWDAIMARRNVRAFADRPIPQADLERVLQAGWAAPSAMNHQHRDFVVCTERAQLEALSQVWRWAGHVATSAATVAIVAPVPADTEAGEVDQFDIGQAVMAMAIAAADLGIGSGHASIEDQDRARAILGVPSDHYCAYLLALGYPADRPLAPLRHLDRRPFDQVVHRGHW